MNNEQPIPVGGQRMGEMGRYLPSDMLQSQDIPQEEALPRVERTIIERQNIGRQRNYPRRIMNGVKLAGAALAIYGGVQVYQALTGNEGSHMTGEVTSEETRVTVYQNSPLELAGIQSDLSLELEAGYDRTVSVLGFEVDVVPINNEYTFNQENLTTDTTATFTPQTMIVEETADEFKVSFAGEMDLSKASIDWSEQEFAGADIKGTSFSVGNELKDEIDNDALEILQDSAEVTAACAVRDEEVQPLLTTGVSKFLTIVDPRFRDSQKKLVVSIDGMSDQTARLYAEAVDGLNATVDGIKADYDGPNDTFDVDITSITNCADQDIKIVPNQPK